MKILNFKLGGTQPISYVSKSNSGRWDEDSNLDRTSTRAGTFIANRLDFFKNKTKIIMDERTNERATLEISESVAFRFHFLNSNLVVEVQR